MPWMTRKRRWWAPFTMELCVHLAEDYKIEGPFPAEAGETVGPSSAYYLGEPADPQQYM